MTKESIMMKRCSWWVLIFLLLGAVNVLRAQKVTPKTKASTETTKSAVKLGTGATVKNTIIWKNEGKPLSGTTATGSYIEGIEVADPGFRNIGSGDFRLEDGSPCIDKGLKDVLLPAFDLWGNKREIGNSVDIGAHEFTKYVVHFQKNVHVTVIEQDAEGHAYDSTHILPGDNYVFRLQIDIADVEHWEVKKVLIAENMQEIPEQDGYYIVSNINADITIVIELDPPVTVAVEPAEHGKITATTGTVAIPGKDSGKDIYAMQVLEGAAITVDTVSDPGYYCKEVWVQEKGAEKKEGMSYVGKKEAWLAMKEVTFSAVFAPCSYPVVTSWNAGGKVVVKEKDSDIPLFAEGSGSPQTVSRLYETELSIQAIPDPACQFDSIVLRQKDGKKLLLSVTAKLDTKVPVDGLWIEVFFSPQKYMVSWTATYGDLAVEANGKTIVSGDKVAGGTVITIKPVPQKGYVLQSLTAAPESGTEQLLTAAGDGSYSWTVNSKVVLKPVFEKEKYTVVLSTNTPAVPGNKLESVPVITADASGNQLEYGAALQVSMQAATGYQYDSLTLNGKKVTEAPGWTCQSVEEDMQLKAWFSQKVYAVYYLDPQHGSLLVEVQDQAGGDWQTVASGEEVYDGDRLKVTATPDEGYQLKTLTVNSSPFASGNEKKIDADQIIVTEFEPISYTVHIQKTESVSGSVTPTPEKGKVILKDMTTGIELKSLDLNVNEADIQLPYGTKVGVRAECEEGYGMTGLDTLVVDKIAGNILPRPYFTVTQDMTLKVLIAQTAERYTVNWQVENYSDRLNRLSVYRNTPGDVTQGADFLSGTVLKVEPQTQAGDTCVVLEDQNHIPVSSPYHLTYDVTFFAKFVPLCTLRIQAPEYSDIIVRREGKELSDGDFVPAGSVLTAEMKVKDAHLDSVRCMALTLSGIHNEKLWHFSGTVGGAVPIGSGSVTYTIPEKARGEVIIGGKTDVYYKVRYTPANWGNLAVIRDAVPLTGNKDYWLPKGAQLLVTASGNEGYDFTGTFNTIPSPREELLLTETTAGKYQGTVVVDQMMDIVAEFQQQQCEVGLQVIPATAAAVVVKEGTTEILTTDGENATVVYGTNLSVWVTPEPGYELLSIQGGKQWIGDFSGVDVRVVRDTLITVTLGRKYQIRFNEDSLTVRQGNRTLADQDWVIEGTELTVTYTGALTPGMECRSVTASWTGTSQDIPLGGRFVMPAADVRLYGNTQWKHYQLSCSVTPQEYGTIRVVKVAADGTTLPLQAGETVAHGEMVQAIVDLAEDETGKTDTWYYVDAVTYAMNNQIGSLEGKTTGRVFTSDALTITGNTDIAVLLERKLAKLYVKVDPSLAGFQVKVTVSGVETLFEQDGMMNVPVGKVFMAEPIIPDAMAEEYEVTYFPDASRKQPGRFTKVMPEGAYQIQAGFGLKTFKVLLSVTPKEGGDVLVKDAEGRIYVDSTDITYGTSLEVIRPVVADPYYRLKELKGMMKGVDQLAGMKPDELRIGKVTDTVRFQALFERLYRIKKQDPADTGFGITHADTNAVEGKFPAATQLMIKTYPEKGYEVKKLLVNEVEQVFQPDENGIILFTIPENTEVKELYFQVVYGLKVAAVTFIASGQGVLHVEGLPGGGQDFANTPGTKREVNYFTNLVLSAKVPATGNYKVVKYRIYEADGRQKDINAMDTTLVVQGDLKVEVVFKKHYRILYEHPEYGELIVRSGVEKVNNDTLWPGGSLLNITVRAEEGYELDYLYGNKKEVVNHTVTLPEEGGFDTVRIEARMKIQTKVLTVVQPTGGRIEVELWNGNEWEALEVAEPVVLEYWTRLRARVILQEPDKYTTPGLTLNEGKTIAEEEEWIVKEDATLRTEINPREYTVTWQQPLYGELQVTKEDGTPVEAGQKLPYLTKLVISVVLDDPEGYEVKELTANGVGVEDDGVWVLQENTLIFARIGLFRWQVNMMTAGEGEAWITSPQGILKTPRDSVDHYTRLKLSLLPAEGWAVYSLEVLGAEMDRDSSFRAEQDIDVIVVFREQEPYLFPAVFTPNGDGYNDTWIIRGLWQSPQNKLEIFNRLQQRVYKASPYQNDWNGETDSGDILPAGNYVYRFTLESGKEYMGMVSIIRN